MDPLAFSTKQLRLRDQHEAWREWFQPVFDVHPDDTQQSGFGAEYLAWQLADVTVTRVSAPAARSVRTAAHIRRTPVDHWVVTHCASGSTELTTRNGQLDAPAGVPFVWSLGIPSDSHRTVADRLQLYLPRDSFADIGPLLDAAERSLLNSALGNLLGDFMFSIEHRIPTIPDPQASSLSDVVRALVVASVAPSIDNLTALKPQIEFARLGQVRQVVHTTLRSPRLGPGLLGRKLGMSRTALYRLLEPQGGVNRFIQRARLLAAHKILCDPTRNDLISRIAEDFCFYDVSSFGRAFRKEFGYSPSDARAAGHSGSLPEARREHGPDRFSDLLLLLRASP